MKKILSIDGGGIRGLIPALVLAEMEKTCGRQVHELFDLVAGTSTGGILALGLTAPQTKDSEARPYTAVELAELYLKHGPDIFACSPWRRYGTVWFDEKYSADTIESVLQNYFGDMRLSHALVEVLVPAYSLERRTSFFFKRHKAREEPETRDFPMWEVARSTSAAPTYFEPYKLMFRDGQNYRSLVDGGVYANNPAMCAYVEAKKLWPDEEIMIVSLGTGELTRRIAHDEATSWGLLQWAQPVIDVVFDGVADTIDYQLDKLLNGGDEPRYFRFQTPLDQGSDSLDDASELNMRLLRLHAEQLLETERDAFERGCDLLF